MCLVRKAALALLLAALSASPLWAQRGRAGGPRAGRGSAPAADAEPSTVQDLYRAAKQSIAALPTLLAPALLGDVARDEMQLFPAQGLQDYTSAFNLALALPRANSPDDVVGQAALAFKQQVELEAVSAIARRGDLDRALALARMADVPRAPLYDELILLTARDHDSADPQPGDDSESNPPPDDPAATAAAAQKESDAVFALVQECKRSSGTYPYTGVAGILRSGALDADTRLTLLQDAYQWAGNETAPDQMAAAARMLQVGHRVAPELDGPLETALVAMLSTLGSAAATPFANSSSSGNRLMALLAQVDASRAEALARRYPNVASQAITEFNLGGAAPVFRLGGANGANSLELGRLTFSFSTTVRAAASMDEGDMSSEATGATQFLALLSQAESLQRRQPDEALALANRAAGMLDSNLWASQTAAAMRLAELYDHLGAHPDAERILSRALDEATQQARTLDTNYLPAAPEEQAAMAPSLRSAQVMVLEVFSLAARLDLPATAQRAENAQFVLLKPAVLARVALVAQVGMRPARIH